MMMLVTVLQQDLGIHYNPERMQMPLEPLEPETKFFADSRDIFIHGLLGEKRSGTCSSMPVLYVAIGRRLGYPLKLVTTKVHLFVRWDEGARSFNIEGTSLGFQCYPDDEYRKWPVPISLEEEKTEGYLKSLTPDQELAVFTSIRGLCLRAAGNYRWALGAMQQSVKRQPDSVGYQKMFARAEREAYQAGVLPKRAALIYESHLLEVPEGPMRQYFIQQKALVQSKLLLGVPENEIEPELRILQAELAPYQPALKVEPLKKAENSPLRNEPETLKIKANEGNR
jgi:hypothetical protein